MDGIEDVSLLGGSWKNQGVIEMRRGEIGGSVIHFFAKKDSNNDLRSWYLKDCSPYSRANDGKKMQLSSQLDDFHFNWTSVSLVVYPVCQAGE